MQKRRLGRTDLHVSAICLGTMTWGQQNTEAEGQQQMDLAFDRGVNFLDTAELYPIPPKPETQGRTETYIGNWMKARRNRDSVDPRHQGGRAHAEHLVSRRPPVEAGARRHFRRDRQIAEAAADRLCRSLPDPFSGARHAVGREPDARRHGTRRGATRTRRRSPRRSRSFDELVEAGKIRHLGLSNESSWGVMRYIAESDKGVGPRPVSLQNAYNLVNRTFEVNLAETCEREGVSLLALFADRAGLSHRQIRPRRASRRARARRCSTAASATRRRARPRRCSPTTSWRARSAWSRRCSPMPM